MLCLLACEPQQITVQSANCNNKQCPTDRKCVISSQGPTCICHEGFHPETSADASACLDNNSVTSCGIAGIDCTLSAPEFGEATCANETCGWRCQDGYDKHHAACVNSKLVSCRNAAPLHATSSIQNVTILYTAAEGWSTPADCPWTCDSGYDQNDNYCTNVKQVNCQDSSPPHATANVSPVTIHFQQNNEWTSPTLCPWTCDVDYYQAGNTCINTRAADCIDNHPENSSVTLAAVTQTFTDALGWSAIPECNWICNPNHTLENGECLTTKEVDCAAPLSIPQNSSAQLAPVTISYTDATGAWSEPAECAWACNTDYDQSGDTCINTNNVPCISAPPENGSLVQPTTTHDISYTTANGWTSAPDCSWTCNTDYEASGNGCINNKYVFCMDVTPEHATRQSMPLTEVTYTTAGGWTDPAPCPFTCDIGYVEDNGQCINSKEVPCIDNAPTNATSTIVNETINYTNGEWSETSTCTWQCDPDYVLENNACINTKQEDCTLPGSTPPNSTVPVVQVTITYSGNSWSTPAECAPVCNAGYQDNDNNHTCTPDCDNPSTAPCERSAHCSDSTGTTTCVCNWGSNQNLLMPTSTPTTGTLINSTHQDTVTQEELMTKLSTNATANENSSGAALFSATTAANGIDLYRITYNSLDVCGFRKTLSASVILPVLDNPTSLPLISYQHGTIFVTAYGPGNDTVLTTSSRQASAFYASQGYVVLTPDYLGYGSSDQYQHPYHDPDTLASATVDALLAFREFMNSSATNHTWNDTLFMAGYSEGGYATLASQRVIETTPAHNLTITGSAPGAGAYDLHYTTDFYLDATTIAYPAYAPFVLKSYNAIYHWDKSMSYFLNEPYATDIGPKLTGYHTGQEINEVLTSSPSALFTPTYVSEYRAGSVQYLDVLANSVQSWTDWSELKSPTRFYHSPNDDVVPYESSTTAKNFLDDPARNTASHEVTIVDCDVVDPSHYHCWAWYLEKSLEWFNNL